MRKVINMWGEGGFRNRPIFLNHILPLIEKWTIYDEPFFSTRLLA